MTDSRWVHPDKYARIEVERRFLVDTLPEGLVDGPFVRIHDRYLDDTRLRLRRIESAAGEVLARKLGQKYRAAGQDATQTTITTIYLNEAEYRTLALLAGRTIFKCRYAVTHEGVSYSLDVFEGPLAGLTLLESEGYGAASVATIPVPAWADREVTGEEAFSGGALAHLDRESYQRWRGEW